MSSHEKIECFCYICGKSRGLQRVREADKACRSCAASLVTSGQNNPNYGKYHRKPRFVYANVNYDDFIVKKSGKTIRHLYRANCVSCNRDKGYVVNNVSQTPCRNCMGTRSKKYDDGHKRLKKSLASSIRHRLKNRNLDTVKGSKFKLLSFTPNELFAHIENLFQTGMTWENYGEWHIDHRKPDSWFSYLSPDDKGFKESWALENLQPKWALDNIKKGDKYED